MKIFALYCNVLLIHCNFLYNISNTLLLFVLLVLICTLYLHKKKAKFYPQFFLSFPFPEMLRYQGWQLTTRSSMEQYPLESRRGSLPRSYDSSEKDQPKYCKPGNVMPTFKLISSFVFSGESFPTVIGMWGVKSSPSPHLHRNRHRHLRSPFA